MRSKLGKPILCIETGKVYNSSQEVQDTLGGRCSSSAIRSACREYARGHEVVRYGYHWKYMDGEDDINE